MNVIISRQGEGERFVRENRVVTIRLDLPQLSVHEIEFDDTFEIAEHMPRAQRTLRPPSR
jgi:hypothetical protein